MEWLIPVPCIFCEQRLTDGRLYFELHAGPACVRCVERRDLYDEAEPAHCAAGDLPAWPARLAAIVAEATARKAKRKRIRDELAGRRAAGLRRRHTMKLNRGDV